MGTGNRTNVKEGFTKHGSEMTVRMMMGIPNQTVDFALRMQWFAYISFLDNQNPLLIPYMQFGFWTGSWFSDENRTPNRIKFDTFMSDSLSIGMKPLSSRLRIENFAVTRQRLLQGGSTNVLTMDFEITQNLFMLHDQRRGYTFEWNSGVQLNPWKLSPESNLRVAGPMFDEMGNITNPAMGNVVDKYTREAIPQTEAWEKTWNWEDQLSHNYIYRVMPEAGYTESNMPNATGAIDIDASELTGPNSEIIDETRTVSGVTYQQDSTQNRTSCPMLAIGQPPIPDETGRMKFAYYIKVEQEMWTRFWLREDIINLDAGRQVIPLPYSTPDTTGRRKFRYVAYEFNGNK